MVLRTAIALAVSIGIIGSVSVAAPASAAVDPFSPGPLDQYAVQVGPQHRPYTIHLAATGPHVRSTQRIDGCVARMMAAHYLVEIAPGVMRTPPPAAGWRGSVVRAIVDAQRFELIHLTFDAAQYPVRYRSLGALTGPVKALLAMTPAEIDHRAGGDVAAQLRVQRVHEELSEIVYEVDQAASASIRDYPSALQDDASTADPASLDVVTPRPLEQWNGGSSWVADRRPAQWGALIESASHGRRSGCFPALYDGERHLRYDRRVIVAGTATDYSVTVADDTDGFSATWSSRAESATTSGGPFGAAGQRWGLIGV